MQNDDKAVYDSTDSAEYEAKLDAIAGDPTLSVEEKADAITNAMEEEMNEISAANSTSDDRATASEPAASSPASSPEVTADLPRHRLPRRSTRRSGSTVRSTTSRHAMWTATVSSI
jgi:hypothetical protein